MYSSIKTWTSSLTQIVLGTTRNKIITSIVSTTILITCVVKLIKFAGSREHRAKKKFESQKRTPFINKLPKGHNLKAPEPGTTMINDFRTNKNQKLINHKTDQIRIITWNIERGYRTNEIINELKKTNADIILLQEVDIGTQRTDFLDVGNEIANALSYQIIYAADCWHINAYHENDSKSKTKNKNVLYNSLPHNGCEGNAILTRFNIIDQYPLILPCVRNSYRPSHYIMKRHTAVVVVIDVPNIGEIVCYSLHFDAFSGRIARSSIQYKTIYEDITRKHTKKFKQRAVIVAGDLNTHNHGVARFINEMSGDDALRYKFWGMSEAEWWDKYVIGVDSVEGNIRLRDPFDKNKDITACKIWNGINVWSGKIDWLLYDIDKLTVVDKYVSNTDASDHQYLFCDIKAK